MTNKTVLAWLPLAIASTIIFLALYVAVQQDYRSNANDPQVQLAEDAVELVGQGISPIQMAAGMPRVDVTKSLATFVMFFTDDAKIILSSGFIGNGTTTPSFNKGALEEARKNGQNTVTWQISSGQRFATVVRHYGTDKNGGFILIARSLREVENRIHRLSVTILLAWLITLVATYGAVSYKRSKMHIDHSGHNHPVV